MSDSFTEVSLIAQQTGNTFEPYRAKAGGTIELLQTGQHSAEALIQKAEADNRIMTWILRAVGFFVMFIGLAMLLKPLSVLADVLPLLGSIVGAGTAIIAFLTAATLSTVTIAIAWVVYRPLLGIVLLLVAGGLGFAIHGKMKGAKAPANAAA